MELHGDESIIFERGPAVLTGQRLLVNQRDSGADRSPDQAWLKDIVSYRKVEGGQDGRLKLGLACTGVGAALIAILMAAPALPNALESIVFAVGASGGVFGLYVISVNPFRMKPHTTIFFQVPEGTDLAATFPGRDNPDADELARLFVSAKRRL